MKSWRKSTKTKAMSIKEDAAMKKVVLVVLVLVMVFTASVTIAENVSLPYLIISNNTVDFCTTLNVPVYSGPGYEYLRGANGKAQFISEEFRYVGLDGNWLLVRCKVKGGIRYGYIDVSGYPNIVRNLPKLWLSNCQARINRNAYLWDSMKEQGIGPLTTLVSGTNVTYLGIFNCDGMQFAYVEVNVNGQKARGFVDVNSVDVASSGTSNPQTNQNRTVQVWKCPQCGSYNDMSVIYCATCGCVNKH